MTSRPPCGGANNVESAMLEEYINPVGIKLFFNVKAFFCFGKQIWFLVT